MAPLTSFQDLVYAALKKIPDGSVITYEGLAKRVGKPGAARAIGSAMARNPYLIVVPCHRVVYSDGAIGNYSAPGGSAAKRQLLVDEGVRFTSSGHVDPSCIID